MRQSSEIDDSLPEHGIVRIRVRLYVFCELRSTRGGVGVLSYSEEDRQTIFLARSPVYLREWSRIASSTVSAERWLGDVVLI